MATDSIQILGESIGYWLQTVAIVSSACAAVVVIWHNGKTARLRATIDMLISEQRDDEYNEKYASLSKLINTDKSLVDYARFLDTEHQEFDNIRFVLNRLEFIAQGIRVGAFEEKIYKDLNCTKLPENMAGSRTACGRNPPQEKQGHLLPRNRMAGKTLET